MFLEFLVFCLAVFAWQGINLMREAIELKKLQLRKEGKLKYSVKRKV